MYHSLAICSSNQYLLGTNSRFWAAAENKLDKAPASGVHIHVHVCLLHSPTGHLGERGEEQWQLLSLTLELKDGGRRRE